MHCLKNLFYCLQKVLSQNISFKYWQKFDYTGYLIITVNTPDGYTSHLIFSGQIQVDLPSPCFGKDTENNGSDVPSYVNPGGWLDFSSLSWRWQNQLRVKMTYHWSHSTFLHTPHQLEGISPGVNTDQVQEFSFQEFWQLAQWWGFINEWIQMLFKPQFCNISPFTTDFLFFFCTFHLINYVMIISIVGFLSCREFILALRWMTTFTLLIDISQTPNKNVL